MPCCSRNKINSTALICHFKGLFKDMAILQWLSKRGGGVSEGTHFPPWFLESGKTKLTHTTEEPVLSTESRASSSLPLDTSKKQIKPSCNYKLIHNIHNCTVFNLYMKEKTTQPHAKLHKMTGSHTSCIWVHIHCIYPLGPIAFFLCYPDNWPMPWTHIEWRDVVA